MTRRARDVMTPDPACCTVNTSVDEIAKLMVQNNCGEIPVVDHADHVVGVVTDRDIVCRASPTARTRSGTRQRSACPNRSLQLIPKHRSKKS